MTYNGWSNYPTWCVAMWIDNDEVMQQRAYEIVRVAEAKHDAADELKHYIEESAALIAPAVFVEASFVADLYGYAIGEVDWYEVAEHYMEEEAER